MSNSTASGASAQAIPPRPHALSVISEHIPQQLKGLKQYVIWRYFWNADRKIWDKPPLNGRTGNAASSTNPGTWSTYEQAITSYTTGKVDGIGFVLCKKNHLVAIDLDHCRNRETGQIEPWAQEIINTFGTYTELSPSGTGVHLLAQGHLPGRGINTGQGEMGSTTLNRGHAATAIAG